MSVNNLNTKGGNPYEQHAHNDFDEKKEIILDDFRKHLSGQLMDDTYCDEIISNLVAKYTVMELAFVIEELPIDLHIRIYRAILLNKNKGEFLLYLGDMMVAHIFALLSSQEIGEVLNTMMPEDIVTLSQHMNAKIFRDVLTLLSYDLYHDVSIRLGYGTHTAGRLMSSDYLSLYDVDIIKEAMTKIRVVGETAVLDKVYVLSTSGELVGQISMRSLITCSEDTVVGHVMQPILYKAKEGDLRETLVHITEKYKVSSIPVTDDENCLIGIINVHDLVEIAHDIARDALGALAGIEEEDPSSVYQAFIKRTPWLCMTIGSGLSSAYAIGVFTGYLGHHFMGFAACFIPLITGLSGNIGIQSSTVFVRGMALGEITKRSFFRMMKREILSGVFSGIFFGLLLFGLITISGWLNMRWITVFELDPVMMGLSVGIGMFAASIWAAWLGTVLPIFFSYMKLIDIAVAAGPVVTALNDVVAMMIYLSVVYSIANLNIW